VSETPYVGSEPACGICGRSSLRGTLRDWSSRRHLDHWKSIDGQRQAELLVSGCLLSKTGDAL